MISKLNTKSKLFSLTKFRKEIYNIRIKIIIKYIRGLKLS